MLLYTLRATYDYRLNIVYTSVPDKLTMLFKIGRGIQKNVCLKLNTFNDSNNVDTKIFARVGLNYFIVHGT